MTGLFDKIKKASVVKPTTKTAPKKEVEKKVEEKVEMEKTAVKKMPKNIHSNAFKVLLRPIISEKASIAESLNVYVFKVDRVANKNMVKQAVKETYGVLPEKVRIVNVEGKATRTRFGSARRSDWKKALVTLPKGQSIRIHEGV